MGRKGGNSWLRAVKRAFSSPSKYSDRKPELDEEDNKKREKRRWFFRKFHSHEQLQQQVQEEPPSPPEQRYAIAPPTLKVVAAVETTEVVRFSMPSACLTQEYFAATIIQTVFRGYLARRALRALKGLVKLQALVRGHNVRKRANMTLQCMQSLVRVQARFRDEKIRLSQSLAAAACNGDKSSLSCSTNVCDWRFLNDNAEKSSMKAGNDIMFSGNWSDRPPTIEQIQAMLKSRKEVTMKREETNSYPFTCDIWRSDCNLSPMEEEEGQSGWLDQWMASRTSFCNRRSSRARASMDHRDQIKTLELDMARPFSYNTPRRQLRYVNYHISSPHRRSSVTPSPSTAQPLTMAAHSPSLSARVHSMPNYMAATESAMSRLRSLSVPRQRPSSPASERVLSAKKRLSFPVSELYSRNTVWSPSYKSVMGRLVSEQRSNVSSSYAESFGGKNSPSSTTELRRWLR